MTHGLAPAPTVCEPGPSSDYLPLAQSITRRLAGRRLMDTFAVTRVVDETYVVLAASDRGGIPSDDRGRSLRWADSFCYRMWHGMGPGFALDTAARPGYADAAQLHGVGAYLGVPIVTREDELIGTLCGWANAPQSLTDDERRAWVNEVQALARVLAAEFATQRARLCAGRDQDWASVRRWADPVTGLPNREAWLALLRREEARGGPLAEPSGVVLVDARGLRTERALRRATAALTERCTDHARLTRIGPHRFGVLCAGWSAADVTRLRDDLVAETTRWRDVSVASAMREHHGAPDDHCGELASSWHCGTQGAWQRCEHELASSRPEYGA